jgi:hypothetical protein
MGVAAGVFVMVMSSVVLWGWTLVAERQWLAASANAEIERH